MKILQPCPSWFTEFFLLLTFELSVSIHLVLWFVLQIQFYRQYGTLTYSFNDEDADTPDEDA